MNCDINYTLNVAGNQINVRFDVQTMTDCEQTLELLKAGMSKKSFFALLDAPYDIREMAVMLMHGINGMNRFEKIDKRMSFNEATDLLQKHFMWIATNSTKQEEFVKAQNEFMQEISNAARVGIGFQKAVKQEIATPQT